MEVCMMKAPADSFRVDMDESSVRVALGATAGAASDEHGPASRPPASRPSSGARGSSWPQSTAPASTRSPSMPPLRPLTELRWSEVGAPSSVPSTTLRLAEDAPPVTPMQHSAVRRSSVRARFVIDAEARQGSTAPVSADGALSMPDPLALIEDRLECVLPPSEVAPQRLHSAMRHAVFSGGKRLRPRLLLTVLEACQPLWSEAELDLGLQAAAAVELIHSASLVHDDLPTFDDAAERRGRPTVHMLYGEPIALLAGDALLALAFEIMADTPPELAMRALRIVKMLGLGAGSCEGLIGGQSLEGDFFPESASPRSMGTVIRQTRAMSAELLERYHHMKTGALFRLATAAGAATAGKVDTSGWAAVGQSLGLAYQLADDLYDIQGMQEVERKPVRQDVLHGRPNAVLIDGLQATRVRLGALLLDARETALGLAVDVSPVMTMFGEMERQMGRMVG
jgi:geranylgeranyl diphosphate synthase type II